jgi:hypothetical protein
MSRIANTIIAIIIMGAFPALSVYTWSNTPHYTEENAIFLATQFLYKMPTYAFDGMSDTVNVVHVDTLRMPNTWEITIEFTSSHGGYGDRTGQIVTMVLTQHQTKIVVSQGQVISVVTDGVYDEVKGSMIPVDDIADDTFLTPEAARDAIIGYILTTYPQISGLQLPDEWAFEDTTPTGILGHSTFVYSGLGWKITVSFNIVLHPVYTVNVEHSGDTSFTWEGNIDQSMTVTEKKTSLTPLTEIITPEEARDIAINYATKQFSQIKDLNIPTEWSTEDLTPQGLLGYGTTRFTSGNWTVEVGGPVVLHPTYTVNIIVSGELGFSWSCTVQPTGEIS